jgi:cytochrome c oxidase subunit 2
MKLLILLVVILGLVAIVQLAKVYQLSSSLRAKREEDISEADNRLNGGLFVLFMVLFYGFVVWSFVKYGDYLPPAASVHGEAVDRLMNFNLIIITLVFFLVNTLLFVFAAKYYHRKGKKAKFFAHDNRLELVWTVIPSIVLAVIIAYGLKTWNDMTGEASEDAIRVELYSKQFDWTARYPGVDGEFGLSNFNLISAENPLGLVTSDGVDAMLVSLDSLILAAESELAHEKGHLLAERSAVQKELHGGDHHGGHGDHAPAPERTAALETRLKEIDAMLASDRVVILSEAAYEAKEEKLDNLRRHRQRVAEIKSFRYEGGQSAWEAGFDDQIVKGEFHLPVGKEVEFVFRSRDVIHSAYMPHFRAQMNTVPGVPTRFKFTPTITTDSMRTITNNPEFDYVLLCNKVCGAAHFNMQMKIVVESEADYQAWLAGQNTFIPKDEPAAADSTAAPADTAAAAVPATPTAARKPVRTSSPKITASL